MSSRKRIMVVSGWQQANIGDVAHTPGLLALIQRELPGVDVTVWPFKPLPEVFLPAVRRRFPDVEILAPFEPEQSLSDPRLLTAMDESDFLLHGSGPATLGWRQCEAFADRTSRGFGVFGVTYGLYGVPERATLDRAAFAYFRDSPSLDAATRDGVTAPMQTTADCAFAFDMRDDTRAKNFLERSGLEPGGFLCALARLRHTPFWQLPGHGAEIDPVKVRDNDESSEALTVPILEAVTQVIRHTPMKVLLCPEDMTQVAVTRHWIYDRLPDDVRPRVVWRDSFWTPDEAASVYAMSAGVFGSEQHSPILAISAGVPAVLGRWASQSTKGFMWRDIGLGDWLSDFDDPAQRDVFPASVLRIAADPASAANRAAAARSRVQQLHATAMWRIRSQMMQ